MKLSITKQYVFLLINGGVNFDFSSLTDFLITSIVAGLLELKEEGIIKDETVEEGNNILISIEKDLPNELDYLKQLYNAILVSKNKTLYEIVELFISNAHDCNCEKYSGNLVKSLIKDGMILGGKQERLGTESKVEQVINKDRMEQFIKYIREVFFEENDYNEEVFIIAKLLQKTGMLREYFTEKEESTIIRKLENVVEEFGDSTLSERLKLIDKILLLMFRSIAILM